jgi:hypothetical protein
MASSSDLPKNRSGPTEQSNLPSEGECDGSLMFRPRALHCAARKEVFGSSLTRTAEATVPLGTRNRIRGSDHGRPRNRCLWGGPHLRMRGLLPAGEGRPDENATETPAKVRCEATKQASIPTSGARPTKIPALALVAAQSGLISPGTHLYMGSYDCSGRVLVYEDISRHDIRRH